MIIIKIKKGESIERALKRFKYKVKKTGIIKDLRDNKQFEKKSVKKRKEKIKAKYIQSLKNKENES